MHIETQLGCCDPRGAMSCGSPMPRGERIAKPAEWGDPLGRFAFRAQGMDGLVSNSGRVVRHTARMKTRGAVLLLGVLSTLGLLGSCREGEPLGQFGDVLSPGAAGPTASNPVLPPNPTAARIAGRLLAHETAGANLVYVSFPPGTVPDGGLATIRNTRTGTTVQTPLTAGGFDPMPIDAREGDTLAVDVEQAGGGMRSFTLRVPRTARPIVVRTDPPPGRRDVALNARIVVVFSEPIDPRTAGGVSLSRGSSNVTGHGIVSTD